MVGYPESITDPSYRGQILVLTFPMIGNYGVPKRDVMEHEMQGILAHFESMEVHVAALIVAIYAECHSHYLAHSSLGAWLQERNIPAIWGLDTRALTKKIRIGGSLLGRVLQLNHGKSLNEHVPWLDPNSRNLVAEGAITLVNRVIKADIPSSFYSSAKDIQCCKPDTL